MPPTTVHCQERMRRMQEMNRFRECVRPVQDMNHCQHRPGCFRECARPMQEMNHCRHGPGRFRKCDRPVLEIIDCRHGPACFRKCARPVMEIIDCRHGPACFRKCARPVSLSVYRCLAAGIRQRTWKQQIAGMGQLVSGNVRAPFWKQ